MRDSLGVGGCAVLSVLANNFTLLGLAALPLYGVFLGEGGARRRFWPLAATVGLVYLFFGLGYAHFAGIPAASSLNHDVLSRFPGPAYLLHLFFRAVLSPLLLSLLGALPIFPYGLMLPEWRSSCSAAPQSGGWGPSRERRLGCGCPAQPPAPASGVPGPVSKIPLTRPLCPVTPPTTLMGALLLVGTAWVILSRKLPPRPWAQTLLPLGISCRPSLRPGGQPPPLAGKVPGDEPGRPQFL